MPARSGAELTGRLAASAHPETAASTSRFARHCLCGIDSGEHISADCVGHRRAGHPRGPHRLRWRRRQSRAFAIATGADGDERQPNDPGARGGPGHDHQSRVRRRRPDPGAIHMSGRQRPATVGVVRAVERRRTRTRSRRYGRARRAVHPLDRDRHRPRPGQHRRWPDSSQWSHPAELHRQRRVLRALSTGGLWYTPLPVHPVPAPRRARTPDRIRWSASGAGDSAGSHCPSPVDRNIPALTRPRERSFGVVVGLLRIDLSLS
jgi:hypothetical protein